MSQITIQTPRGVFISGTFTRPVDSRDAAVIFSHTFLSDRHASGMFDSLGRALRRAGYATLAFDFSGHGESGDEIITFDPLIEDFRAASGWLADQGFARQICVGHEFGATVALRANPPSVQTYVLVSPVLGPLSYDWDLVFSDVQLSDLERHGTTTVPDDSCSVRRHFTINKGTLADMSMVSGEKALRGVTAPILITHDSFDEETGLVDRTRDAFHLLPVGSLVEMTEPPVSSASTRRSTACPSVTRPWRAPCAPPPPRVCPSCRTSPCSGRVGGCPWGASCRGSSALKGMVSQKCRT